MTDNIPDEAELESYEVGKRVKQTGEAYEVFPSDSPAAIAFWDGYYGRPLRHRTWPCM